MRRVQSSWRLPTVPPLRSLVFDYTSLPSLCIASAAQTQPSPLSSPTPQTSIARSGQSRPKQREHERLQPCRPLPSPPHRRRRPRTFLLAAALEQQLPSMAPPLAIRIHPTAQPVRNYPLAAQRQPPHKQIATRLPRPHTAPARRPCSPQCTAPHLRNHLRNLQ